MEVNIFIYSLIALIRVLLTCLYFKCHCDIVIFLLRLISLVGTLLAYIFILLAAFLPEDHYCYCNILILFIFQILLFKAPLWHYL